MFVEYFYELLEQAESLFQAGQFTEAKRILEILLADELKQEEPNTQCYLRLMYVETLLSEEDFDVFVCRDLLYEAEKYCSQIDDYSIRNEFSICLYIDFSKMYIDKGDFANAQDFVLQALEKSIDYDNLNYYLVAIHNFVLLCQAQTLFNSKPKIVSRYSAIIKKVLFANKAELGSDKLVTLFLKMSEISFINGDIEQGNIVFQRAFELEKENDSKCGQVHAYIVRFGYIIHKYVKSELLTETVKYVSRNVLEYIDDIIDINDEATVYKLCVDISGVLRIFISYVYIGVIECSNEEYFEYVSNLKNIYSLVLTLRNKGKTFLDSRDWLKYDELIEKMPDNTVLVDYTQFPAVLREERLLGDLALSCFSLEKHCGQVFLSLHEPIYLLQERTLHLFLNATTRSDREHVVEFINGDLGINYNLYNLLLEKVLVNTNKGVDTLLICPDVEVGHIPFSILMDKDKNYLVDRYKIAYVDSFRCFQGEYNCSNLKKDSALILGDPRYTIDSQCNEPRNTSFLQPLPLSKVESEIVAELLETHPVIKEYATKSSLNCKRCQILHIATHGEVQDIEEEEEGLVFPLSRCCMYFAGANDYQAKGLQSTEFGNGILTAEELLEYEINDVKMCVLSICFSGNGQVDYSQGMLGFRTVFLSKGVRVLISSLWEVDDFASAVFFANFYKFIFIMSPSETLRKCQMYLKNVSLKELKQEGWFDKKRIKKLGLVASHMEEMSHLPDETRLFHKHKYWAGFILTLQ